MRTPRASGATRLPGRNCDSTDEAEKAGYLSGAANRESGIGLPGRRRPGGHSPSIPARGATAASVWSRHPAVSASSARSQFRPARARRTFRGASPGSNQLQPTSTSGGCCLGSISIAEPSVAGEDVAHPPNRSPSRSGCQPCCTREQMRRPHLTAWSRAWSGAATSEPNGSIRSQRLEWADPRRPPCRRIARDHGAHHQDGERERDRWGVHGLDAE